MANQDAFDDQLRLFATSLTWQEFPHDVRRKISQLLAVMCIEIVDEPPTSAEEIHDESRSDPSLAS